MSLLCVRGASAREFCSAVGRGLRMTECVREECMSRIGGSGSDVMGTHDVMMMMSGEGVTW